ncbi:HAD-like domain-containing protein [Kalaharituber pfeilii]|nr:HAD-like domain-containing protein [Kalaharituber pfeilii]
MESKISVRGVLLDIGEGTVCSISFVRDVLFPYALNALPAFLEANWDSPDFVPYKDAFPQSAQQSPAALEAYVRDLTEKDVKVACLKDLQGLLWRAGYENGSVKAPIYPDVFPAIKSWTDEKGLKVMIYSSGSVAAQKLLFRHTNIPELEDGDMTTYLSGYFDTVNAGMKQDPDSYRKIAQETGIIPQEWLFLSDNVKEIEAAKAAGMASMVVVRPGNASLTTDDYTNHRVLENGFGDINVVTANRY